VFLVYIYYAASSFIFWATDNGACTGVLKRKVRVMEKARNARQKG
jgi:hypothetical protein